MNKTNVKFFYGQEDIEYHELIDEFTDTLKKKTYKPQFDKVSEVVALLDSNEFPFSEFAGDKVLINTIMITQIARYYWMMGNYDVQSKGYEVQYRNILRICRAVYWDSEKGFNADHDLEDFFRMFTKNKMLKEFYFPKKEKHYLGFNDPWTLKYKRDLDSIEKKGYADSELWSVDYALMKFLLPRAEGYLAQYESGNFCIELAKYQLTDIKNFIKFVSGYIENGPSYFLMAENGFLTKKGKLKQKAIDDQWAFFGKVLSGMWW